MFILCIPSSGNENSTIHVYSLLTDKLIKSIDVEGVIVDVVKSKKGNIIYITNAENGCLYKIDFMKEKIIKKYKVGLMPNNMVYKESNIYISDVLSNSIIVFDTQNEKILDTIKVGKEPNSLLIT